MGGASGALDLVRALAWYGFILHMYRRSAGPEGGGTLAFLIVGLAGCAMAAWAVLQGPVPDGGRITLLSLPVIQTQIWLIQPELGPASRIQPTAPR